MAENDPLLIKIFRKIGLYSFLRTNYHKYLAYRALHPKWNLVRRIVEVKFLGKQLRFKLTDEANQIYDRPIYKCEPLIFLVNERKGYFPENKYKQKEKGYSIDVGAYQGAGAVYMKKILNSQDKIICFEPDKENISILKQNLKLNKVKDVKIVEKGVWNKEEALSFSANGEAGHLNLSGNVKIKVTDLDSELKRLNIPYEKVSFVKMDIEGAEIEAIEGMKELLTEGKPFLSIATYHERDGEKTSMKIEEKLKKLGYKVETGYQKHLTTWAWKD